MDRIIDGPCRAAYNAMVFGDGEIDTIPFMPYSNPIHDGHTDGLSSRKFAIPKD
jgi:hypothetical protein